MKSKLFKQHQKDKDTFQPQDNVDNEADIEIESAKPSVSNAKNNKIIITFLSLIFMFVVVYFLFFKTKPVEKVEKLEEVNPVESVKNVALPIAPVPTDIAKDLINDSKNEEEADLLKKPKFPELPKLPKDVSFNNNILPSIIDVEKEKKTNENQQNSDQNNLNLTNPSQEKIPELPKDPRKSPIVVESRGGVGSYVSSDQFSGGIIALNPDSISMLEKSKNAIVPTLIGDKTIIIAQGKMMSAVLETAINTELPGSIRGIISRDVYAEAGNNVLIPKGSRLYGSYSTQVLKGQARVQINWTRLIRPDGVDLKITFVGSDQFGRSGIEGDLDNKYGPIITNSLLTSVLAITGVIAAEKLSDSSSTTTTTNASTGTVTTSGSAASQVIADVAKTMFKNASDIATNSIDITPVIRIPQGTKITIVVNGDMKIPPLKVVK